MWRRGGIRGKTRREEEIYRDRGEYYGGVCARSATWERCGVSGGPCAADHNRMIVSCAGTPAQGCTAPEKGGLLDEPFRRRPPELSRAAAAPAVAASLADGGNVSGGPLRMSASASVLRNIFLTVRKKCRRSLICGTFLAGTDPRAIGRSALKCFRFYGTDTIAEYLRSRLSAWL